MATALRCDLVVGRTVDRRAPFHGRLNSLWALGPAEFCQSVVGGHGGALSSPTAPTWEPGRG